MGACSFGFGFEVDDDQPVVPGLRAPDFAGTAEKLAHPGIFTIARKAREYTALRIKTHDGIGPEIRQPDIIVLVHIHGINARGVSGKLPASPAIALRIVDAHLARVLLADPDPSRGVGPDTPGALIFCRRLDHSGLSSGWNDPRDVAAGERGIVDIATRRCRDAVGAPAPGRVEHVNAPCLWIKTAVHAALSGEPEDAVPVKGRGIEVRISAAFGQGKDPDRIGRGIDADDGVLPAVRHPCRLVGTNDHAVWSGAAAEGNLLDLAGPGIQPPQRTLCLGRVPDGSIRRRSHVMGTGARG